MTFYFVIFIFETHFGVVGVMDVNRGVFGSVVWVWVTCIETAFNAAAFTVLISFCSSTTCEVRRCTYFGLLPG